MLNFNDMKEQDVVILLKKLTSKGRNLSVRKLAEELKMSASSVSESLERSKKAQLVDRNKKRVNTLALQEFMVHGLGYVFPAETGRVIRGIPAELLLFPDENHWVLKPQNGILWQRTFFRWLDKWLKN